LLAELRLRWPEGRGVREFLAILQLHQQHPPPLVERAMRAALELGAVHQDGVRLCLRHIQDPQTSPPPLDLGAFPQLQSVGQQPVNLQQYDALLGGA